jgi:hypothetical protein
MREVKRCPACRETKPVAEFNRHSNRPDGLQSVCKPCHRAQNSQAGRRRYQRQKEQRAAITALSLLPDQEPQLDPRFVRRRVQPPGMKAFNTAVVELERRLDEIENRLERIIDITLTIRRDFELRGVVAGRQDSPVLRP